MSLTSKERQKIADAALKLAAETRWRDIALADIAAAAGTPLARLYGAGGKLAVLAEIEAGFDREAATAAEQGVDRSLSPRDRLFEAAMRRFEAMERRRPGLAAIDSDGAGQPSQIGIAAALSLRSARWLMVVAGLDPQGPMGPLEIAAFMRVLGKARAAWREDVHGDLSRTMAALDRGLRDLETKFPRFKPAKARKAAEPAPADRPADSPLA